MISCFNNLFVLDDHQHKSVGQQNYLPFANLAKSEENIILKKNTSLGCLVGLEESHEKFHSSIQNWSLANEGFVKSLVSLPACHGSSGASGHVSLMSGDHVSCESLMSMSSLMGGGSMLDEPDCMEETSLLITNVPPSPWILKVNKNSYVFGAVKILSCFYDI